MLPLIISFLQSNYKTDNIAKPKPISIESITAQTKIKISLKIIYCMHLVNNPIFCSWIHPIKQTRPSHFGCLKRKIAKQSIISLILEQTYKFPEDKKWKRLKLWKNWNEKSTTQNLFLTSNGQRLYFLFFNFFFCENPMEKRERWREGTLRAERELSPQLSQRIPSKSNA